jgi:hypothetical protein
MQGFFQETRSVEPEQIESNENNGYIIGLEQIEMPLTPQPSLQIEKGKFPFLVVCKYLAVQNRRVGEL